MIEVSLRLALGLAAILAGAALARRSLKAATAVCGLLLALILLKVAVGYLPAAEARLFSWDFYPWVERGWYEVPAFGLMGAGLWIGRLSMLKRDAVRVLIGLLIVRIVALGGEQAAEPGRLLGQVRADGLCRQTSPYSCGPAAAAMYLDRLGVSATEAEMAALCVTRREGTTEAGLARGLRRKLPGRTVKVASPPYDRLRAPALVSIILPGRVGHAVLLEKIDSGRVVLADPRGERREVSRTDFDARWQGSAITVD